MTQMMETLASRQMFSVAPAEPTALPVDTSARTEVVMSKKVANSGSKLVAACCTGKAFPKVEIQMM